VPRLGILTWLRRGRVEGFARRRASYGGVRRCIGPKVASHRATIPGSNLKSWTGSPINGLRTTLGGPLRRAKTRATRHSPVYYKEGRIKIPDIVLQAERVDLQNDGGEVVQMPLVGALKPGGSKVIGLLTSFELGESFVAASWRALKAETVRGPYFLQSRWIGDPSQHRSNNR
jgi:hypothetical protein